jgi:hypothetical protein
VKIAHRDYAVEVVRYPDEAPSIRLLLSATVEGARDLYLPEEAAREVVWLLEAALREIEYRRLVQAIRRESGQPPAGEA